MSTRDPPTGAPGPRSRHHLADQLAKSLLRDALAHASVSVPDTEVEVLAAAQRIDVYAVPDPARAAERARLGLLGELCVEASLFEPFHQTPSLARVRRLICKQLTWHHELGRRARLAARGAGGAPDEDDAPEAVPFPWLVVIGPGRPDTVLAQLGCRPVRAGWYEAVEGLRLRVIVLAELPRTRETLLLRLLGAGRLLGAALADLAALPDDAWEKGVAMPLLVHFGLARRTVAELDEEDEMDAEIRAWWEEYQRAQQKAQADARAQGRDEGRDQGRDEGRAQGRVEEAARAVLTVLRVRGVAVPDGVREQILAEKDPARLERWHERAVVAGSIAEVMAEPS